MHEFDANSFRRSLFPTILMLCTTFGIANLDPITFGKIQVRRRPSLFRRLVAHCVENQEIFACSILNEIQSL